MKTMHQALLLTHGRVITPLERIDGGAVLVEGGLIRDVGPAEGMRVPPGTRVIDVGGAWISPGFIELHLHGAWGGDVMAGSLKDLARMAKGLGRTGVTSFLPSTLSGPLDGIERAVAAIDQAMQARLPGARIAGAHLEGPYFSLEQKGAQNPAYLIPPRPEDYLPLLDRYRCIVRVSAAPELPGGLELGEELRRRGIVASIGHSNATFQEVVRAVASGYTHVTHIFSAMSTVRRVYGYRVSGVVEAALVLDELTAEMIADGHHLPPSLMKLVLKAKGADKVCLVTDSMTAAGMGPGEYSLGGLEVVVESDIPGAFEIPSQEGSRVAKLPDRSAFASSVATMDQLLRTMTRWVGLSLPEAVKLVTLHPARMQGLLRDRGLIGPGMKADLAVFDDDVRILMTLVDGEVVYQRV
jgi:N-acetylglucosamine-6-phosphate deacetylase